MSIASWLAGASRRIKTTFAALVASGQRSEKRAAQLIRIVEKAGASEFKPVKGSKGARYFLPGAPKTAPTISRTEYITRKYGAGPKELAAERKTETRGYLTEATRKQAEAQRETRSKRETQKKNRAAAVRRQKTKPFSQTDRRLNRWRGFRDETAVHLFLSKDGDTESREFKGRNLAIAQNYRDDWYGPDENHTGAVFTGDGSALAKYDLIPVYDVDGGEVHFETDVEKLRAWWFGMDRRQREEFEKELFYLKDKAA